MFKLRDRSNEPPVKPRPIPGADCPKLQERIARAATKQHKKTLKALAATTVVTLQGCATLDKQDVTWLALHAVDVGQTVTIARNGYSDWEGPGNGCWIEEKNPITAAWIGKDPDPAHVYRWGVGWAAIRFGVFWAAEKLGASEKAISRAKTFTNGVTFGNVVRNQHFEVRAWANNVYSCE